VFRHACKLGLEGIVSKRKDSPYRSGGRSPDWLKMKNPNAPAVRREAEEDQLELVPSWFSPRNLPPLLLSIWLNSPLLQARRYALGRFSVFEARKPCAVASFSHM
jgi:bifunctional non-homologous end joining protein LigD